MSFSGIYTHLYIDISHPVIYFGQDRLSYTIGEALLHFLYFDLNIYKEESISLKQLSDVHPFFSTAYKSKSLSVAADKEQFSLKKLQILQQQYLKLIEQLAQIPPSKQNISTSIHQLREFSFFFENISFVRFSHQIVTIEGNEHLLTDYYISSFEDCLMIECTELIRRSLIIKRCKNCQLLFIAKRQNIDFCQRNNGDHHRKCSEVGYMQTYNRSVKNDDLLLAYTRAYKTHYARMSKPRKKSPNLSKEEFTLWATKAKEKLELARTGQIDSSEFKEWLKI